DFSFKDVAGALGRSGAACRQLAARARAQVRAVRPRRAGTPPSPSAEISARHAQLLSAFIEASRAGDLAAVTRLLASDVRRAPDGGGKGRSALEPIEGADRAAQVILNAGRKRPDTW